MAKQSSQKENNIVKNLTVFLANSYILYVKTQNFHWNVVDPRFYSLHKFFEEQYEAFQEGIDEIAERIRMLQAKSPGSMTEFLKLGTLKESSAKSLSANQMIYELLVDHEAVIKDLHRDIAKANAAGDDGTADMMIQRIRFHEKASWMLRSHITGV